MSGDYTKFTFRPAKDHSAILKQQGRVDLDADFNELIEIIDRRWRSETIDIIGHCTVPQIPPGTPPEFDPFLIIPTGPGTFNIGIGRMYVDGIQVENHGLPRANPPPPEEYLADLGELRGLAPVPYNDQPYLPAPLPPLLAGVPGTTDLIYIDVWQREVTVLEDPSLREIALGGPDTTTRIQSAWQVRALPVLGSPGCGDDIPAWSQLVAPSAGRLTTAAVAPPTSDDPCILSPSGGYRGLENRLYRVEIHSTGTIGGVAPAKFKWSRNNATIASSVLAIPSTTSIVIQHVGRDPVLRFRIGDWIEITDNFREFGDVAGRVGQAGHMAQITGIDEANRIITFNPAIAGINFNPADPSRHTRVRRWDQSNGVDANGLLDVTAAPIDIEDGIRVTFSLDPPAGGFKIGDYWVFAARTADGSVEILQNAPPRGILHHFCRLGFVHWGDAARPTTFDDCRDHWPPHCCEGGCTVTVGDGVDSRGQFTDIQQAINALGNRGGVVCVGRGVYPVTQTIKILGPDKRNIIIRGMGPATRILFTANQDNQNFLEIDDTEHVRIEGLFVASRSAQALIRLTSSHFCTIEDCTLVSLNLQDPGDDNAPPNGRAIAFVGKCVGCLIRDNFLLASKGITSGEGELVDLQIRNNRFVTRLLGIFIQDASALDIVRNQLRGIDIEKWRGLFQGQEFSRDNIDDFQKRLYGVFQNATALTELQAVGILIITARSATIRDNWIAAQFGIVAYLLLDGVILDNRILALIGVFLILGVAVKVSDNLLLGLLVGVLHAGILVDLLCEANTFLGFIGIELISMAQVLGLLGPFFALAIRSGGFSNNSNALNMKTLDLGFARAGGLIRIGAAAILKIHRNVFVNFLIGIQKTDTVLSADLSIIDNTFLLCAQAGIDLGEGQQEGFSALFGNLPARHLIQSNAFSVSGTGIISGCDLTQIHDNTISGRVGMELGGNFSSIRNNHIEGLSGAAAPGTGLIRVNLGANDLTISGNRLINGQGHGILIRADITRLKIENNVLQKMKLNGISTATEDVLVRELKIVMNRVERCDGGDWRPGALVLGEAQNIRVTGNTFAQNGAIGGPRFAEHTIHIETVEKAGFSDNMVADNEFGGIRLVSTRGDIRIQGNTMRDNGGRALDISGWQDLSHLLIQNNYFATENLLPSLVRLQGTIDSLHYQGNQSFQTFPHEVLWQSIYLEGRHVIVNANIVRVNGSADGLLASTGGALQPPQPAIAITSNLISGGYNYSPSFSLVADAHNLIIP